MPTGALVLLLLAHHSLGAPQVPSGTQREESPEAPPPPTLANPFGPGDDNRRLLQSYIKANAKEGQGGPEINTWEQEVFYLFLLHDYDRSGHLDGLELMKFISDYNSHNAPGTQSADSVVSTVDFLLQTQDVNRDGLLAPSELLAPPLPQQDSASRDIPEVGVASEGKSSEPGGQEPEREERVETKVEGKEEEEEEEEEEERKRQEPPLTLEEHQATPEDEQKEPQLPEAPAADQDVAPAHRGQPEM